MAFTINNNLVFIGSMQFMNLNLDTLVKNFSDNDFKYLWQEFNSELLNLVKQKGAYPYEYMDRFGKFFEDKSPDTCKCISSLKINLSVKKLFGVWNVFKMNTIDDYHDFYLRTEVLLLTNFINWNLLIRIYNIMD